MKKINILIGLMYILSVFVYAKSSMSCNEYYKDEYSGREKVAKVAKLKDNYMNRYHEDVVYAICKTKEDPYSSFRSGYISKRDTDAILAVFGKNNLNPKLTSSEISYRFVKEKLDNYGLCSYCSDNATQWYVKRQDSKCANLVQKALDGNQNAINILINFPDYCEWNY